MRDILPELAQWLKDKEDVALATVVSTWGSAPRPAGSRMGITKSGKIAGSVSGGCLEGDVYERAQQVLAGQPAGLFHYGVSDDLAWSVGLSCGGEVDILIERLNPVHRDLMAALQADRPVVLASALQESPLGARQLLGQQDGAARQLLEGELPQRSDGVLLEPFPRLPEMLIFGGSHIAIPLSRMAREVGFAVSVIDARSKFADPDRFPAARRVVRQWPDEFLQNAVLDSSTYIVILTHDPKFDDPIIRAALQGRPRYVGAIGSRKTHRERVERLEASGVSREALACIHAPVGLDIGARTAEETALAILAQVVAVRHGRPGGPMPGNAS